MATMNDDELREVLATTVARVAHDFDEPWEPSQGGATPILADGGLSSLVVVALVTEVEMELSDRTGADISLASDSFLSATSSPLETLGSFTDFVAARLRAE